MATREQMMTALRNADKAGDSAAASRIAGMIKNYDAQQPASTLGKVGQSADDAVRILADSMTRGYADKLLGPEEQARTQQSRERTSDWVEAPLDIAGAVIASPYRIGSTVAGGVAGGLEGMASAYGHQKGWVPEVGNIASEGLQGALLGSGAAKAGEWLGKGWNRLFGEAMPPMQGPLPEPRMGRIGAAVQTVGNLPREATVPADAVLAHLGLPPVVTGTSTVAQHVSGMFKPKSPPGMMPPEPDSAAAMRDFMAKAMAAYGRSP